VFTWDPCGVPRLCTFCLFAVVIIDVAVFVVVVIVVDGDLAGGLFSVRTGKKDGTVQPGETETKNILQNFEN
jgi:hypothetical protein